jgi:hypothetical protein
MCGNEALSKTFERVIKGEWRNSERLLHTKYFKDNESLTNETNWI